MKTFDCDATMTDTQVLEFCRQGFAVLEAIVPPDTNQRTLDFLNAFYATQAPDLSDRTASIPTDLFSEDWFWENVIVHPQVMGVVRSLMGRDFALPSSLSNHRVRCPMPAVAPGRHDYWHRDGGGGAGVPELERVDFGSVESRAGAQNCLQVFYYPEDVPLELGPTELVPGSHLILGEGRFEVASFLALLDDHGDARDSCPQAAPAGTITITLYPIWHRRTASTGEGVRNNFKYRYFRAVRPHRDWAKEPGFKIPVPGPVDADQPAGEAADAAEMFAWLSGIESSKT